MNRFAALLLGLAFVGGAAYFARDELQLRRHGVAATATVVDARNVTSIAYGSDDRLRTHNSNRALLEFTPDGGEPVRFKADFWSRQQIGDDVPVLYDADDPTHAIVDSAYGWFVPAIVGFLGVVSLLYALGITSSGLEVRGYTESTLFSWRD